MDHQGHGGGDHAQPRLPGQAGEREVVHEKQGPPAQADGVGGQPGGATCGTTTATRGTTAATCGTTGATGAGTDPPRVTSSARNTAGGTGKETPIDKDPSGAR